MAISSANAAAAPKTRRVETLVSGTSWTVPTDVTYVNATLIGGGGGSASGENTNGAFGGLAAPGLGGVQITTTVTTTPGASITYAIGAGGAGSGENASGSTGGTTTFTGATSAAGGSAGKRQTTGGAGTPYLSANNGGSSATFGTVGGAGGSGCIILEYWVQEIAMKKFAVIENNKVVNIIVGVEDEVVAANPGKYIEYTNGWDYNNGIDGGDFFPVPVTE